MNAAFWGLVIPTIILGIVAQLSVKYILNKYSNSFTNSGLTAGDVARRLLDDNGMYGILVVCVPSVKGDNYNAITNIIRLSEMTYVSDSIAAISIAIHETGHAIQYASGFLPVKIRDIFVPVAKFAGYLSMFLVFVGVVAHSSYMISLGIIIFMCSVLFHVVTLPIEFNASARVLNTLEATGILDSSELEIVRKILLSCSMAYVATTFSGVIKIMNIFAM